MTKVITTLQAMSHPTVVATINCLSEMSQRLQDENDELKAAVVAEREAMMQLFTDPENQPTQHGTVTVEYMQREIAAEREACAKVCEETDAQDWMDCAAAIRAKGQA